MGVSLIYSSDAYGNTKVTASGNYHIGTDRKITDGAAAVAPWYGLGNGGNFYTTGTYAYNAGINWGSASAVADGGTITHNMGTNTAVIVATPTIAGEMVSVTSQDATSFTVAIKKHDGGVGTTQTIHWQAYR